MSFSQDGFIKAYDFGHAYGVLFSNMVLNNDTIAVSGIVRINYDTPLQGILFAKMDTLGNIIDYKFHYDDFGRHYASGGYRPYGFIKLKDNSGYMTIIGALGGGEIIIKLDNEGDIVWIKEHIDDNAASVIFKEIMEVSDGFIIGGRWQSASSLEVQVHLMKVDKDGNKIWERTYGSYNRLDHLSNILVINDNEIVVGSEDRKNTSISQNMDYSTRIFAVDSLGNVKWNWKRDNSLDEIWIRGLNRDNNGNWVYASAAAEYEYGWQPVQPKLIIRDSAFNLIEEKILDDFDGDDNHFYNLIPVSDGGWLGVGTDSELVSDPFIANGHAYAWMSKMNAVGDTLWQRNELTFPDTLPFATKQILHSAVELPSGSFIAAGYYQLWDPNTYGILMKVNKHGCMDEVVCTPTIVSVEHIETEKAHLSIYPNPTNQNITINYQLPHAPHQLSLTIYNITGKSVHTQPLPTHQGSVNIQLDKNLPAGTYFCHLTADGQVIDVERFVLIRN